MSEGRPPATLGATLADLAASLEDVTVWRAVDDPDTPDYVVRTVARHSRRMISVPSAAPRLTGRRGRG